MARNNTSKTSNDIAAIEREIGKLMHDLETRIGRLNTLTKQGASHAATEATEYVTETLAETLERLRATADDAAERVRNGAHAVSDEALRVGDSALRRIEEEIEQRPLLTLAIAAGIGFLAGMAGRRH